LPSGIFDHPQPPFPAGWFTASNAWSGEADGDWWWVFAGQVGVDEPRAGDGGVVLLEEPDTNPASGATTQTGPYVPAGAAVGGLSVVSVSGDVVTLSDGAGETFAFNLGSLGFT
jgi:hypothetical protein